MHLYYFLGQWGKKKDYIINFSINIIGKIYLNNPKYWDTQALANSVDPDKMPQNVAYDQDLVFAIHTAIF